MGVPGKQDEIPLKFGKKEKYHIVLAISSRIE